MQNTMTAAPPANSQQSNPPPTSGPEGCGYSVWRFDGSKWQLKKNCAVGDAVLSEPPSVDGKFKGQLRSTACVAV